MVFVEFVAKCSDIFRLSSKVLVLVCYSHFPLIEISAASPAKRMKKRQKMLGNIHSLVFLLNKLQNRLTQLVADTESEAKVRIGLPT